MVEGAWENQFILPGGIAATPYLGARLDSASYDGAQRRPDPRSPASLLSATPIAAMDIRWPLMAKGNGRRQHLFEPIAQIVYRGSSTTEVGITNDDAQSFVFDDTLLSYNRFSGIDRQETGLRANIGGRYLANFADGSWLQLIGGQSFFLAGSNALGIGDHAQIGTSTGSVRPPRIMVLGARAARPTASRAAPRCRSIRHRVARHAAAGVGVSYAPPSWFSLGVDYIYLAADPAIGIAADQHEIAGDGAPDRRLLDGEWRADLEPRHRQLLKAMPALTYDDGYLRRALGGYNGVNFDPHSVGASASTFNICRDRRATAPSDTDFGRIFRHRGHPPGDSGFPRRRQLMKMHRVLGAMLFGTDDAAGRRARRSRR